MKFANTISFIRSNIELDKLPHSPIFEKARMLFNEMMHEIDEDENLNRLQRISLAEEVAHMKGFREKHLIN
jgi:hypothetical protein